EGVGIDLANDRQRAVPAIGAEDQLARRIKRRGVGALPYRQSRHCSATVSVDDDEALILTAREEPMRRRVDGEAVRRLALRDRPSGIDLVGRGIDAEDLPLLDTVHVDLAVVAGNHELELAPDVYCCDHPVGLRID